MSRKPRYWCAILGNEHSFERPEDLRTYLGYRQDRLSILAITLAILVMSICASLVLIFGPCP